MKKLLPFKKITLMFLIAGCSLTGWSQLLYEGFNYATPAYIGGNGDPGSTSNNWTTHSVTAGQTTTIDIVDGSLTYPGFATSTGNKVYLFSNANAVSRDINRGFVSTSLVLYYSALVNIIDNSQIATTPDNYFMHFGAATGAANTTFGGRLGVVKNAAGTNFRFIVLNTSGGTPVYSDNGADLNFGTTYLVVVKYDLSAALTVATMWVNPGNLAGSEPTGGVSNSTGTNAFTSFATGSICLRNNAATPKAHIDEIRVGATWASVTPISGVGINENPVAKNARIYPNPCTNGWFNLQMPDKGRFVVTLSNSLGSTVKTLEATDKTMKIETTGFAAGLYFVSIQNIVTGSKEVLKLVVR
jgi:hypothetical protein